MAPLADGEVHVWYASPATDAARRSEDLALLSPAERERATSSVQDRVGGLFIARRALLRRVLAEYLECRPVELRFELGDHGKPRIATPEPRGLHFNLSHSDRLLAVAIANRRAVGIDVEHLRSMARADDIVERYFSPAEAHEYRSLPPAARPAAFFAAWCRKEAFVKALGTGLTTPLNSFTVSITPGMPAALRAVGAGQTTADWHLSDLSVGPGYAAALAVAEPVARVRCRPWSGPGGPSSPGA